MNKSDLKTMLYLAGTAIEYNHTQRSDCLCGPVEEIDKEIQALSVKFRNWPFTVKTDPELEAWLRVYDELELSNTNNR